jgi:hypothetical protein
MLGTRLKQMRVRNIHMQVIRDRHFSYYDSRPYLQLVRKQTASDNLIEGDNSLAMSSFDHSKGYGEFKG